MPPALCGSLTFHSRGYIVSVCPSLVAPPQVRVIDPSTLELLATYDMPNAPDPPGTKAYQNFAGGGYFFLDGRDRVWSATKTSHLFVLQVAPDGRSITKLRDYDLTSVLAPDERISSALPDFKGRIWFVSKKNGKVAHPQPEDGAGSARSGSARTSRTRSRSTGAASTSSRASACTASAPGTESPWCSGRRRYRNTGIVKPGQADAGSGTTPTIMKGGYVAITDNADPMNVVVYRKAVRLRPGQHRVVCRVPVFDNGRGRHRELADHQRPLAVRGEQLRLPGPVRAELGRADHAGLRARRREPERHRLPEGLDEHDRAGADRGPEAVDPDRPDLHLHARPRGHARFASPGSGRRSAPAPAATVYKVYAGNGLGFNNNYAGLAIGPTGTAYLGVTGGMIALRDG